MNTNHMKPKEAYFRLTRGKGSRLDMQRSKIRKLAFASAEKMAEQSLGSLSSKVNTNDIAIRVVGAQVGRLQEVIQGLIIELDSRGVLSDGRTKTAKPKARSRKRSTKSVQGHHRICGGACQQACNNGKHSWRERVRPWRVYVSYWCTQQTPDGGYVR